ncbi:uncharacterized protein LOC129761052 [Uranotaenia lowii]|uniref:uncharacterized protein LOC129761052 n=1 Tax=Uranotaenia lowii TaxID=190385 RepID=UPI0024797C3F|nr:uncharacterized protein LOC129761052 [Uranotaenia lowii]
MAANEELQAVNLQMTKLLQRLAVLQAANPEQVLESLSTNISEFSPLLGFVRKRHTKGKHPFFTSATSAYSCGPKALRYADIRARLLSRIEGGTDEAPVTIQTLIDEFQRIVNLKSDTTMIEHPAKSKSTPRTPCWQCGQMHFVRDCPFSDHLCKACNRIGHKEGYCGCMRKSGDTSTKPQAKKKKHFHKKVDSRTEAKGIYVNHITNSPRKRRYVTVTIDQVAISLQLNSASDITVISKATYHQLGKPKLTPSSIEASNASGGRLNLIGEFNCDVTLNGMSKSAYALLRHHQTSTC